MISALLVLILLLFFYFIACRIRANKAKQLAEQARHDAFWGRVAKHSFTKQDVKDTAQDFKEETTMNRKQRRGAAAKYIRDLQRQAAFQTGQAT